MDMNETPQVINCILDGDEKETADDVNVFSVNVFFNMSSSECFEGACIDSGATLTVIGRRQAEMYSKLIGVQLAQKKSGTRYRFGDNVHQGHGKIRIRIPVGLKHFAEVSADVVDPDVPFLLGLDVLTKFKIILDFDKDMIRSKCDGWAAPIVRKFGHAYLEWLPSILYTEAELRRVHRHFFHPSTERLAAVIKRSDPSAMSPQVIADLDKIKSTCDVCQREAGIPHRFRVSMPASECIFNRIVCLDIMKLDGISVLHVVDRDTKFSAATFLSGETTSDVWEAFLCIWVAPYAGYPENIAFDQGRQFTSTEWEHLMRSSNIVMHPSGVESHNALGVGERYHSYLRRVYNKVRADTPILSKNISLALAVQATNDTAGPTGLVPTLLVFGISPRLPVRPRALPEQVERMKAAISARKEMVDITSKHRIRTALKQNVPAAADMKLMIGEEVLMYREKPTAKWVGPYVIEKIHENGKQYTLNTGDRTLLASIDKLKKYNEPSPSSTPEKTKDKNDSGHISQDAQPTYENDDMPEVLEDSVPDDLMETEELMQLMWPPNNEGLGTGVSETFTVMTLKPNDPRADIQEFITAKKEEIEGLRKREVWTVVKKKDVPIGSNVIGGRFVLSFKAFDTPEQHPKARFVAQGHNDRDKSNIVHDTATIRPTSIRLIISVSVIRQFRIFSHDVTQAYVQSKDKLTRMIYIRVKPEDRALFGISDDELLLLTKPLYGICDAGDYWGITIEGHVVNDLGMQPLRSDPALYAKFINQELCGITGIQVDDSLNAGDQRFEKITEATLTRFDSKPRLYDTFDFFGSQVATLDDKSISLGQPYFARNLTQSSTDIAFEEFRRCRALFSWLGNTRPDIAFAANKAAQVSEKTFCRDKVRALNRAINSVQKSKTQILRYAPLDHHSLELRVYADASFACNDDLSSQLGFIILLCDNMNRAHVLDYASKKSKRVVRSIMAGEVYAFMDAFDTAFSIAHDLTTLLGCNVPILMFTDSKQLFDALTKGKRTTEKRLMIDIATAREAYKRFEIFAVGLLRGDTNPADALTKENDNGALDAILSSGIDNTSVAVWINRSHA